MFSAEIPLHHTAVARASRRVLALSADTDGSPRRLLWHPWDDRWPLVYRDVIGEPHYLAASHPVHFPRLIGSRLLPAGCSYKGDSMTDPSHDYSPAAITSRRVLPGVLAIFLAVAIIVAAWLWWENQPPGTDSADAGFARDMTGHHAQAVEMALIAFERTGDPAIRQIAYDIATSQQAQIGMMTGWLNIWNLSTARPGEPMEWAGATDLTVPSRGGAGELMSGLMPGHLTQDAIDQLRTLDGTAMDIEFLRLMIIHHEGGIVMAGAAIDRANEDIVLDLADAISIAQTAEIAIMQDMLAEREGI